MDPTRFVTGGRLSALAIAGIAAAVLLSATGPAVTAEPAPQSSSYTIYVCAESDDIVEKIAFGGGSFQLIKSIPVGIWPTEIEGPHGLAVSPDGRYWFLSMAHAQPGPFGTLYKFDTASDTPVGEVELGMFPATMAISPSIGLLYVVNFNLHGLPEPSSISVVDPESMSEVGRVDVGVMPHGARMNREGTRLYSANMMDDTLTEIDTYRMEITRMLAFSPFGEHKLASMEGGDGQTGEHGEMGEHGGEAGREGQAAEHEMPTMAMVKPTWATPPTPQGKIYVAGNGAAKIFEIDVEDWEITRTFETAAGPYNIDVSADGRILAVTYKSSKSVGFWNLESGEEVGRVDTLRPIPHGIVITPDGRYAFATIEGIGGEPGSVEAYDLQTFERVDNIDIGKQAGGIVLWMQ